jgi:hypothetical protein
MSKTLLAAAALLSAASAQAISVPSSAFTYTQNFDTLTQSTTATTWTNDSTLPGWSLFIASGAAAPTILGGTGSSTTGSFFSFGAASAPDRALGGLGSGGTYFGSPAAGALAGWIAVSFSNDTGAALSGFTIGFDGEQWRDGGATTPAAQSMVLQYGFGSTFAGVGTWVTPGGSFNWSSPVFTNTASGAAIDGNVAGKVTGVGGSVATSWAAGATLWVRWVENNDQGNDHGLAIDNLSFSVSAVPEPGSVALLLAGLAAVAFVARRRA